MTTLGKFSMELLKKISALFSQFNAIIVGLISLSSILSIIFAFITQHPILRYSLIILSFLIVLATALFIWIKNIKLYKQNKVLKQENKTLTDENKNLNAQIPSIEKFKREHPNYYKAFNVWWDFETNLPTPFCFFDGHPLRFLPIFNQTNADHAYCSYCQPQRSPHFKAII